MIARYFALWAALVGGLGHEDPVTVGGQGSVSGDRLRVEVGAGFGRKIDGGDTWYGWIRPEVRFWGPLWAGLEGTGQRSESWTVSGVRPVLSARLRRAGVALVARLPDSTEHRTASVAIEARIRRVWLSPEVVWYEQVGGGSSTGYALRVGYSW